MSKLFLAVAFFISIATLPWWASVLLGILFVAEGGSVWVVVFGGFILDELFGAPIASLGGFAYLYTALFIIIGAVVLYLRSMLFE